MNGPCPRTAETCPASPCPGRADPSACDHWRRLATWRRIPHDDQADRAGRETRAALDPRVRDAVLACPDRGAVLPASILADCGCHVPERTECRAGRGVQPGRVSLRECLACQGERLRATPPTDRGA